jgi:polar amino acid transport system permease protein
MALDFDWRTVREFLWSPLIREGAWRTIQVAVLAQLLGVLLGGLFAILGISRGRLPRFVTGFYVWFFRGTPALLQLLILYFGLPELVGNQTFTNELTAFRAAIIAFGINEGAYMTEIVRAGILAIDPGQMEAAKSLGMTYRMAMQRVVLPQAARVIVPPLGNEFNNMLKTTSLLVAISVAEIYVVFSRKNASGPTVFHPFELFIAAAIWYLLLTTIWGFFQARIERRLARGTGVGGDEISLRDRLFRGRIGQPRP